MALSDRTLVCVDCSGEFVFTVGEQEFFNSRGFVNDPKRCQTCRSSRRSEQRGGGGFDGGPREMHPIVCAQCGNDAMVPFRPRGDRPVYCSDCFSNTRSSGAAPAPAPAPAFSFASRPQGVAVWPMGSLRLIL